MAKKGTGSREARRNRVGGEEVDIAPFTFDSAQGEVEGNGKGTVSDTELPGVPLGQFGDAEMEFEPFMFDPGDGEQARGQSAGVESVPAGFSFEPFAVAGTEPTSDSAADVVAAQDAPIVGGDLPLPSYLSAAQPETTESVEPGLSATGEPAPMPGHSSETTTGGLGLPTAVSESTSGTDTGGLGVSRGEQMTGRTPTGPLSAVPLTGAPTAHPPTSPVTGLGRTRGGTGPLGPLPPDRTAAPNSSWSDSSLASIEDFSSILIAMQAGKKLRQSGPLSESMIPESATAMLEAAPHGMEGMEPATEQLTVEAGSAKVSSDAQDMPEWAMQAVQSAPATEGVVEELDAEAQATALDVSASEVENIAPDVAQPATDLTIEGEVSGEEAPSDFGWVTGEREPELPSAPEQQLASEAEVAQAVPETPNMVETPATVALDSELPPPTTIGATADAAMAELVASKEHVDDSELSNLEPEVVQTLRNVNPVIVGGNLTGEDIEFEVYMFDQGNATPMSELSAPSAEDLAALSRDVGPAFDPTVYTQMAEAEGEEGGEYDDFDASILAEMRRTIGVPATAPQATSNNASDLPFWLQGETNEAPAGTLIQDIARRGWGTKEFLEERPRQSGLIGSAPEPEPAELSGARVEMAAPMEQGGDEDFGDLPPIEPFDFSLLPTNETVESLGFNTEELIGLMPGEHDPMTITVNLAAVADLLGGEEEVAGEDQTSPGGTLPWQEAAVVQAEEQTQYEWAQVPGEVDTETVTGLDMPAEEPSVEMPLMEASGVAESDFAADTEAEMPTLSLDASAEVEYSANTAQEFEAPSFVAEAENPVMAEETPPAPRTLRPTAPIGDAYATRGWMSSATTDLTDSVLDDMTGEVTGRRNHVTEVDLGDGVQVSPFDYDQLDLEAEEQHTGHLEGDQAQKSYGTGKLAMPDEDDVLLRSRPLNDVWSEADGDASLFVTTPESAGESGMAAAQQFGLPVEARAELEEEGEPTGYLAEETSAKGYAEVTGSEQPGEDSMFRARVASDRWAAFDEQQGKGGAGQPEAQPVPQVASSVQPAEAQNTSRAQRSEVLRTGPLPSLEGFQDMGEWMGQNPNDLGAQMAMASAYAQAEDFDAALRVYRKIVRKPGMSETILRMIGDDLGDMEETARHLPRYYQVVGDLLMRLGRHKEAIEAYNKIR